MPDKTLTFDASSVKTESCTANYIGVEIETDYPEEVLENFSNEDIIKYHPDLEDLYKALKEHYGE